jgi:gluconolactonase
MLSQDFEVHNPKFRSLVFGSVSIRKIYGDGAWTEGPVYYPAGRYLIFSDIPNDRLLRWDETNDVVSIFRAPCGYINGNTLDQMGRLVSCQHQGRAVVRTEHHGALTILADSYGSGRLNSPNDVVVKSDGSIWFTDPTYGIDSDYEGDKALSEQAGCHVYRLNPEGMQLTAVATDFVQPNGLAFSPDEATLYVVDSGFSYSSDAPRHIRQFAVQEDGSLSGGEVFATCDVGMFDGVRIDVAGNIWVGSGDGVRCYDSNGCLLGRVVIPEVVSNLCFGGPKRNRLFITATRSVYTVPVNVRGCG